MVLFADHSLVPTCTNNWNNVYVYMLGTAWSWTWKHSMITFGGVFQIRYIDHCDSNLDERRIRFRTECHEGSCKIVSSHTSWIYVTIHLLYNRHNWTSITILAGLCIYTISPRLYSLNRAYLYIRIRLK